MKLKFLNLYLSSKYVRFISVSLNYFMLKAYYRFKNIDNHNKIVWTDPIWQYHYSVDQLVTKIINEDIDILCLSLFVWNSDYTYKIAKECKKIKPQLKIIVGGPDVNVLQDSEYFVKHPYIDYAVYGDGEEAFCYILDSILDNKSLNNSYNIVTKEKTFPHRIFFDKEFNYQSSFLSESELIKKHVDEVRQNFDQKFFLQLRWERARGCPYSCSFCDWSSGLHHKVKRKQSNWKDELDFLFTLPVTVVPSDANWGIYDEDIQITEYAVNNGKFYVSNFSKLHKERVFKIFDIIVNGKRSAIKRLKISLQDIHTDVLENINRPEIPWQEQKLLLKDFKSKNSNIEIIAEIIAGLPGQSIKKQLQQLYEFKDANIEWIICFFWELIPNSPAFSSEYQTKHNIKFKDFTVLNEHSKEIVFHSIDDIRHAIEFGYPGWSKSKIITQSENQLLPDIITSYALTDLYKKCREENNFNILNYNTAMSIYESMQDASAFINETNIFTIYDNDRNCYVSPEMYFLNHTLLDYQQRYTQ